MKPVPHFIVTALLTVFGLLTTFLTCSIILDLFDIRAREGNYVSLVVWANFASGVLFLAAAFGFFKRKLWAPTPLIGSLAVLILAFLGLMIHIKTGGAYETKTIGAMIFRITVNTVFALLVYFAAKKHKTSMPVKASIVVLLPLALLVAGCGHYHDEKAHDHQNAEGEEAHHHGGPAEAVKLNNGQKWEADEHTLSVVQDMKAVLSDFGKAGEKDYEVLADSLTSQLNVLVAGCTMQGPAHDELHKWLVPFAENVKELSANGNATEASSLVDKIDASLHSFDRYFQGKSN